MTAAGLALMPKTMFLNENYNAFIDKLLPAPVFGGFAMSDYWIWGSSVIKGDDGKYHMFAATGEGVSPWNFERTWNMVIPLKSKYKLVTKTFI